MRELRDDFGVLLIESTRVERDKAVVTLEPSVPRRGLFAERDDQKRDKASRTFREHNRKSV